QRGRPMKRDGEDGGNSQTTSGLGLHARVDEASGRNRHEVRSGITAFYMTFSSVMIHSTSMRYPPVRTGNPSDAAAPDIHPYKPLPCVTPVPLQMP
ncbi:hypothetical protein J5J83_07155, partial [Azoarcus sp. L1K30]|uniref:hypothetical protein n=1 Tax=Azoarcus sp. L1K30 TaxID=2820277 RepID=UPI001B83297A